MSDSHPWEFKPEGNLTEDQMNELNVLCGYLRSTDCDDMTPGLAKHFIHEVTGDRGNGNGQPVDPNAAYNRAMKVCG